MFSRFLICHSLTKIYDTEKEAFACVSCLTRLHPGHRAQSPVLEPFACGNRCVMPASIERSPAALDQRHDLVRYSLHDLLVFRVACPFL